jgi:hypothetical protein
MLKCFKCGENLSRLMCRLLEFVMIIRVNTYIFIIVQMKHAIDIKLYVDHFASEKR